MNGLDFHPSQFPMTVAVGKYGVFWMGAGGLTIAWLLPTSFDNSVSVLELGSEQNSSQFPTLINQVDVLCIPATSS